MTDNEIKQALPFLARCCKDEYNDIKVDEVLLGAFDIINRQQAEIKRLQNLTEKDFEQTAISTVKRHQKWIEYRAIKEFAERLKKLHQMPLITSIDIDDLVKEMVGEEK